MKGLVCKYCGGNHFIKEKEGYVCEYCYTRYDNDISIIIDKKLQSRTKTVFFIGGGIVILLGTIFLGGFLINSSPEMSKSSSSSSTFQEAQSSKASGDQSTFSSSSSNSQKEYTEMELQNPTENVLVAEFSLNLEDIQLAEVSVKKYGGNQTADFEKRLAEAQKQSELASKNTAKQSDHPKQLVQNPISKDGYTRLYYYRQNGAFQAGTPDFDQYSAEDIIKMWGKPDEILTDDTTITNNLGVDIGGDTEAGLTTEGKILWEHCYKTTSHGDGTLTWRDTRAYIAWLNDAAFGTYSKALIYSKQGKPNVYFDDEGKIYYVSPIMKYLAIDRVPENFHPYEGLGKYPDDFPSNYPKTETWKFIGKAPE